MKSLKSSKRPKTETSLLDLPPEVMIQIFIKLGVVDLLCSAQYVCSPWLAIAQDPQLYRVFNMRRPFECFRADGSRRSVEKPATRAIVMGGGGGGGGGELDGIKRSVERTATQAINRGRGELAEFSMTLLCSNSILQELGDKSPRLKCLRLDLCYQVSYDCWSRVIQKLPLLEEVGFSFFVFQNDPVEVVGRFCPKLRSFRLNRVGKWDVHWGNSDEACNGDALAIVANMNPGLQRLDFIGNQMNNNGLEAILDRFSQLEYLDIRRCFNVDLKGDLLRKCQGITTLKHPYDSTDDFEFNSMF